MVSMDMPRYQKQEMLNRAHEHGFKVTEHLLKDWVEKGLLGEAEREWPGHGSISWWPAAQLDLFLELLSLRQHRCKPLPIGLLCVIPIGKWLYLGEKAGGVSLPQVRRAMATWMEYQQKFSPKHIAHCATKMVNRFGAPKIEGKRHLIQRLTELGIFIPRLAPEEIEELINPEQLEYDLIPAFPSKMVEKGTEENTPDMGSYLFNMIPMIFRTLQNPKALLDQPDAIWKWARVVHLLTLGGYLQHEPFFSADPKSGLLFPHATLDYLFEGAGFNLLGCLGAAQQEKYWPRQPILNPQKWVAGEVTFPVIKPKVLFTLPMLLDDGAYVVKHEFYIQMGRTRTKPACVMLIHQFFKDETSHTKASDIPHTFRTYELEMDSMAEVFSLISSHWKQHVSQAHT